MKKICGSKKFLIGSISVILIIILIFFFIFLSRNDSNKIKGVVSGVPANTNFTDMNFYSCVMDAYNKENNTYYSYDYNLSDEQLASIKKVVCNDGNDLFQENENIKYLTGSEDVFYNMEYYMDTYESENEYSPDYQLENLDGIEKLTNIEELIMIADNTFGVVDLKENTKLKTLKMISKTVTFENATSIENLEIYERYPDTDEYNYVSNRINGIASMVNLKKLVVHNASIGDKASFGKLQNLEELVLYGTDFYQLSTLKDLEKLKKLTIKYQRRLEGASLNIPDFNINDHKYFTNLEYLSTTFHMDSKQLPFENLKYFEGRLRNGADELLFDISVLMPNIEKLSVLPYYSDKKTLSYEAPNIEKLKKLNYLAFPQKQLVLDNLDKLTNLKKLELLYYSGEVTSSSNSIEYLYGIVNDYSKFPNLKFYIHKSDNYSYSFNENTNTNITSKIEKIYNFTKECNSFFEHYDSYNNLKVLAGNFGGSYVNSKLNASNLYKMPNLEKLIMDEISPANNFDATCTDNNCYHVDFKTNSKLKYLHFDTSFEILNIDKLSLLEVLKIGFSKKTSFGEYNNLKYLSINWNGDTKQTFDLSKTKKLEYLYVWSWFEQYSPIAMNNINELTDLKAVDFYYVAGNSLDFTNSKELWYLSLGRVDINGLDISTNENIKYLKFDRNSNRYEDSYLPLYLKKGDKLRGIPDIKLPSYIKVEFIGFDNILEKQAGDLLVAVSEGITEVKYKITNDKSPIDKNVLWDWNGPLEYDSFYVSVVDVSLFSEKFSINNEQNYIYVKNITKEKDIIKNIIFTPFMENMGVIHGSVYKNRFKTFLLTNDFQETNLIKITSNKYKIKGNDIIYYGKFNIDNIRVTNATKEVNDNKLIIKYNDAVVDEFKLIKLNDLIGDTNNDGEITISDMILQYKHTEYELELEEDTFYRADIDSNEDVEEGDVNSLYATIKNK